MCRVAVIVCVDNRTLYVDKIEPDDPMSKFLNNRHEVVMIIVLTIY